MTEKDILRAIGNIDAALITEAAPDRRPRRMTWQKWATLAACFCLIAFLAVGYYNVVLRGAQAPGPESFDFETDDPINDLHMLFGTVCALAELQNALPGEIVSTRPMRLVLDRRPFI